MLGMHDLLASWPGYPLPVDIAGYAIRRGIVCVDLPLGIDFSAHDLGLVRVAVIFTLSHGSGLLAVLL
jgi:hypothetical protein